MSNSSKIGTLTRREFLGGIAVASLHPTVRLFAEEKEGITDETREATIKTFLPTSDTKGHELVNANNAYLSKNLKNREHLDAVLLHTEQYRKELLQLLRSRDKHLKGRTEGQLEGQQETVEELTHAQLLRIAVLLEDLLHADLPQRIGTMLEQPGEKERGGDVLIENNAVHFHELENSSKGYDTRQFAGNYQFPLDYDLKTPHLFLFHTHPNGSNAPSMNIQGGRYGVRMRGDIPSSAQTALVFGESHQVVVSTMEDDPKAFNIDYFGGSAADAMEPKNVFDVEARLAHVTSLDLGVYKY